MKVNLIKFIFLYLVTTYSIGPKLKTCHDRIQIGLYFNKVDVSKQIFLKNCYTCFQTILICTWALIR